MMMSQESKCHARPIGTIAICNSHAKLYGQQRRYEKLEVTLNHVRLWTMGDANGGESDEGLRPRSKAGCWTADGEKRMAVAGAGLTRVTKMEKVRPSATHGHLGWQGSE
jgi:hypothetical protein